MALKAPEVGTRSTPRIGSPITIDWSWGDNLVGGGGATVEIQIYINSWSTIYTGKSSPVSYTIPRGTYTFRLRARVMLADATSGWGYTDVISVVNSPPTAPSSITVPSTASSNENITIKWGGSTDADGYVVEYELQRRVDGGSWEQVYLGGARTINDTVPAGSEKVVYRVRGKDNSNAYSAWKTSGTIAVSPNTAPTDPEGLAQYVKLGDKAVGSIVQLNEDGVATNFIVVHQGLPGSMYDVSCDGTWLLREEAGDKRRWHSKNYNDYENSEVNVFLNGPYLARFDADIRARIKLVKIPYRPGAATDEALESGASKVISSGANGLPTRAFLLSAREVGFREGQPNHYACDDGMRLDYFPETAGDSAERAEKNRREWSLRTPHWNTEVHIYTVKTNGGGSDTWCTDNSVYVRPALILPKDLLVSEDGTIMANVAPSTSSGISIPSTIMGGSTITILWGASTDAEGNLEGYVVERSTDGGSTWTQIYQGNALSATNTVPAGTDTVMYRVRAYDSEGLYSGWRNSAQVTVINNVAPAAPGSISVPELVFGGTTLDVMWAAASDRDDNLAGYSLERQVDGGAWETIYRGAATAYTDIITRGWTSVAYRVRAYDVYDAYSDYTVSEARAVDNNAPPAVTCAFPSGSDLGVKSEDFEVSYSVSDEDGDAVTVTESVDGTAMRSFAAEDGVENCLRLGGLDFMRLLNGAHTLSIAASDHKVETVHRLVFTKAVTSVAISLDPPMAVDKPISVCVLSVTGSIPADAEYTVEVTNNALDDEPVWEDCTTAVRTGTNHVFASDFAANGPAFNFRVRASRGASGLGGYITSVQGGFQ